jgi:hypothetical protein
VFVSRWDAVFPTWMSASSKFSFMWAASFHRLFFGKWWPRAHVHEEGFLASSCVWDAMVGKSGSGYNYH